MIFQVIPYLDTIYSLLRVGKRYKRLKIIIPEASADYSVIFNQKELQAAGLNVNYVQENESFSYKGVLRGLHIQKKHPQGKLVRVVLGTIYDVVIDLRENSSTYAKWCGIELSSDNHKQLYIPEGFAHGFYVTSECAIVNFKVSNYWEPDGEIGIPWNDEFLKIEWNLIDGKKPIVAEKDRNYKPFIESFKTES